MIVPLAAVLSDATAAMALAVQLAVVAAAAYLGGSSIALVTLGHRATQVVLSFTGGVLLGVGMLHLLPHAALEFRGDVPATMAWALAGFFGMFLLERAFHGHAHHAAESGCGHDHGPGHSHGQGGAATVPARGVWAWCGALAGLTLHSLADGAALAASVRADAAHGAGWLAGLATFLAVLLHKPLDAAIIATLMTEARSPRRLRTVINLLYAAVVPIGAACFLVGLQLFGEADGRVLGAALAVAGGAFVCIAAADLLPELQFHAHDRVLLTTALVLGIGLAWGITAVERASGAHAAHAHASPAGHGH